MILVLFSALWNFTIGSITFDKTSWIKMISPHK
jgi:hypothetical protein